MPRLLQINPVVRTSTSTGRIMREIGEMVYSHGWESFIAYSKGRDGAQELSASIAVPIGSKLSVVFHGIKTRFFDRHGLGSVIATRRFIREIKAINPDIIQIHNIHGYYLDYKLLFKYLSTCGKPVLWTVHDCWLYTGHCYHYASVNCDRWKTGCRDCPQRGAFPKSFFIDRSARNFKDKKTAFNSVPRNLFHVITVSKWMKDEMRQSFLSNSDFHVIHNGIDTSIFSPRDTNAVRAKYGLGNRKIILGLASIWLKEKGFDDFVRIAGMTREDEVLVMVGRMNQAQKQALPASVVTIQRTDSPAELAELYSAADVFVNPTWQDNYPTVNLESIACGTPVVTYRTGGSVESIVEDETGFIIEQGDVAGIMACVRFVAQVGKERYSKACREYAEANFKKEDRYSDYLKLYNSLIAE